MNHRLFAFIDLLCLLMVGSGAARGAETSFDPNNPAASGFTKIFEDTFSSMSSIDLTGSGAPGFKWYITRFFGYGTAKASNLSIGGDGLTINPTDDRTNWQLATVGPASNAQGYVGTAFSGGAYFEARIRFDRTRVVGTSNGWPSFWALAVEHMTESSQWPGQATGGAKGYQHFIENDFFEYLNVIYNHGSVGSYCTALHDWYGIYNTTCPGFCGIENANRFQNVTPQGDSVDWNEFHTISQLWIAASDANGNAGSVRNYFDGVLMSSTSWSGDKPDSAPPPAKPHIFSVMDHQHLGVILGTGINQPMVVQYVRVWSPPK